VRDAACPLSTRGGGGGGLCARLLCALWPRMTSLLGPYQRRYHILELVAFALLATCCAILGSTFTQLVTIVGPWRPTSPLGKFGEVTIMTTLCTVLLFLVSELSHYFGTACRPMPKEMAYVGLQVLCLCLYCGGGPVVVPEQSCADATSILRFARCVTECHGAPLRTAVLM